MTPLANALYALAALLGVPSLAGTLYFGWAALRIYLTSAPTHNVPPSSDSPNVAITAVDAIGRAASAVFGIIGAVGEGVVKALFAGSLVVLLIALAFYFTGRGLHAHSGWARGTAAVMMIGTLLIAAIVSAISSGNRFGSTLAMMLAAGSVYGLWILWKGFA